MPRKLLQIGLTLFGVAVFAFVLSQNALVAQAQVPNRGVQRLESTAREMSKRSLTDDDRKNLIAELTRAALYSARTGEEENALLPGSFLGKVLETNFPDVFDRTTDRGLTLAGMLRYFHSFTLYRPVIDEVLQKAKANGACKK